MLNSISTEFIFQALLCGAVGTAAMTLATQLVPSTITAGRGLVTTIGSIFTVSGQRNADARTLGFFVHTLAGLSFGVLYCLLFRFFDLPSALPLTVVGTLFGGIHGFTVFFVLIPLLAEHHRVKAVRDEGPGIAVVYFLAHILFGFFVGLTADLLQLGS